MVDWDGGCLLSLLAAALVYHNDHIKRIAPMALSHRLRRDPLDDTGSTVRVERTLDAVLG